MFLLFSHLFPLSLRFGPQNRLSLRFFKSTPPPPPPGGGGGIHLHSKVLKSEILTLATPNFLDLKSVYIEVLISSQEELDLRTFETMSVQYVINESIFRIFVTIF